MRRVHVDSVAVANLVAVASLQTDDDSLEWAVPAVVRLDNTLRDTEARAIPTLSSETV